MSTVAPFVAAVVEPSTRHTQQPLTAPDSPSTGISNNKMTEGEKLSVTTVTAAANDGDEQSTDTTEDSKMDVPKAVTPDTPKFGGISSSTENETLSVPEKPHNGIHNRGRCVSLDRGRANVTTTSITMEKQEATSVTEGATSIASSGDDSSLADSSDGESSYFNKKLPSPKSGRRFSYSSNHSAPSSFQQRAAASDASLSFSDESDESDMDDDDDLPGHMTESPGPVSQLPPQVADMQLQRITRMHSVSSLVSSASEEEPHSPQSTLSRGSSSELSTVKASSSSSPRHQQSGRISPVPAAFMAHHQHHHQHYGGPSPPNIAPPGYAAAEGMPHPQPLCQEQITAWMSRMASAKSSTDTMPFCYSDDDETDESHHRFLHHLANSHSSGGIPPGDVNGYNTFGGGNSGGGASLNPHHQGGMNSGGIPGGGQYAARGPSGEQDSGSLAAISKAGGGGPGHGGDEGDDEHDKKFKVYWQRWIMLFYMSLLNLLSDWTCYSVAPIAILTQQTFGAIDPEQLVVIFLGANAVASACEPIILARLGLRKTVLFGALLLMLGSMIKSGGIPPLVQAQLVKGQDEWRLYLGFFLVGLSQPLYQCTPALLSAAWFPESERTMATGVALNANQLGIGFAFIFGTLLVASSEDIPNYFGLLSIISTLAFFGTLFQFDDAPPTPPSDTAKIMRGDLHVPDMTTIFNSVRNIGSGGPNTGGAASKSRSDKDQERAAFTNTAKKGTRRRPSPNSGKGTRRRPSPAQTPSNALWGPTSDIEPHAPAPSPMMPGPTQPQGNQREGSESSLYDESPPIGEEGPPGYPMYPGMPYGMPPPGAQYNTFPPQGMPYYDPRMQQQPPMFQQPPPGYYYPPPPQAYYYGGYQNAPPMYAYGPPGGFVESYPGEFYDGAEPEVNVSNHHLDINIRDDQVLRSIKACFSRPGFVHCLVSFTVSGIVINTLSTFMDYLVTLNGAEREYVGIVGGSFQGIIMISSLIIGNLTDKSRAYYSVIIAMLVLGAFGLAQCGVSLDADRGSDLRWSLLIVAGLIGPLQPVSTELGVDVAYPLSENTVLVIQQLFSNLISALFIPFFKSLKDIGLYGSNNEERPEFTFSFYLLILLHAAATVFFATFNGRYLRYEHELEKAAKKEMARAEREQNASCGPAAFYPVHGGYEDQGGYDAERTPLTNNAG